MPVALTLMPAVPQQPPLNQQLQLQTLLGRQEQNPAIAAKQEIHKTVSVGLVNKHTLGNGTVGYLSFHPKAQCAVHALKGLACHASPSRARGGHKKHIKNQWVQKLGTRRYSQAIRSVSLLMAWQPPHE